MFNKCPGAANMRTPTIKIKKCPRCDGEVEIFSTDIKVKCPECGFIVYNDLESCIQWCEYAKKCIGEEQYRKLKRKKIAFVCTENSCRSQIAEALAKKLCDKSNVEFVSMGTHPANEVDRKALEVLKDEGITWYGKPKIISNKESIDVLITMGCDVICSVISDVKIVRWEIPDPKG